MNVGQFRYDPNKSYKQDMNVSLSTQDTNLSTEYISGNDLVFRNICIIINYL